MVINDVFLSCINVLHGYKAVDIVSYHNKPLAERILVSSCESSRQVKAVASNIIKKFKEEDVPYLVEGLEEGNWVLIDSQSIILHIFRSDVREYYDIDSFLND